MRARTSTWFWSHPFTATPPFCLPSTDIAPPLNASVCSLISQLPTSLSPYQLSLSRHLSDFSWANAAMPVKVTNAAINTLRPKNLYMTSVSLMSGVFCFYALRGSEHVTPRIGTLWQVFGPQCVDCCIGDLH